jgi:hypothetical protein
LPAKDSAISFQPLTHYAGPDIPTAIVRPSIIGSTWKEPYAGWIDNFNGPAGLSLAAGTGVMRVMPGDRDVLADIVPVDSVVSKSMVCWLVRIRLCVYVCVFSRQPLMPAVQANFTITVPWFIAHRAPAADVR